MAVGTGRLLIVSGILILAFAAFQLWGTGFSEARAQASLADRFERQLAVAEPASTGAGSEPVATLGDRGGEDAPAEDPPNVPAGATALVSAALSALAPPAPQPGEPVGVLDIPAIGVHKTIVEGTSRDTLRTGPGHYRSTPLPGRGGNTAIAGHRTTHGAPFLDIDLLEPGDEILIETATGTSTYVVESHLDPGGAEVGHFIVDPSEVGVIADTGEDRLTLTACHPKYSARQRIVVTAALRPPADRRSDPQPAAATTVGLNRSSDAVPSRPARTITPASSQEAAFDSQVAASLGWQRDHAAPTGRWAGFTALIAIAGHLVGRMWRRWPAYAMTVPPFCLALFHCFVNLEKLLPAV